MINAKLNTKYEEVSSREESFKITHVKQNKEEAGVNTLGP